MKTIFYFIENHSTNWPLIWSDCSPFIVVILVFALLFVIWKAKKQNDAISEEYLLRTTVKLSQLTVQIDALKEENKKLFASVRKRDEKGHFLTASGKGHGRKKQIETSL